MDYIKKKKTTTQNKVHFFRGNRFYEQHRQKIKKVRKYFFCTLLVLYKYHIRIILSIKMKAGNGPP